MEPSGFKLRTERLGPLPLVNHHLERRPFLGSDWEIILRVKR